MLSILCVRRCIIDRTAVAFPLPQNSRKIHTRGRAHLRVQSPQRLARQEADETEQFRQFDA